MILTFVFPVACYNDNFFKKVKLKEEVKALPNSP